MHRTLMIISFCQSICISAQITLEHTYDGTGSFNHLSQLMMIELEVSGLKYVAIDQLGKEIRLYHMDHTLYKTISFANAPSNPSWPEGWTPDIMYISEHLFDLDDDVEYMFAWNTGSNGSTSVLDEDGSIHFHAPGELPLIRPNIPLQQLPIYNTPLGTKMILSTVDSTARVYSLPGELTVAMILQDLHRSTDPDVRFYPNPGSEEIYLELGVNMMMQSSLIIYDALGNMSKEINLKGDAVLNVTIGDLAEGMYYLVLSGVKGYVPCGSFIKQ